MRGRKWLSRLPSVLSAAAEQFDHVGEEEAADVHQLGAGGRVL